MHFDRAIHLSFYRDVGGENENELLKVLIAGDQKTVSSAGQSITPLAWFRLILNVIVCLCQLKIIWNLV